MADVTVNAADVRPLPGADIERFDAGGTATVGESVYMVSDGDVEQSDADAAVTARVIGIIVSAPNGATAVIAGNRLDIVTHGPVTGFTGLTPGGLMYASITAGKISDTRPAAVSADFVWIIGWVLDATTIYVDPFTDDFAAQ